MPNDDFDDDKFFEEIINDLDEKAAEKQEPDEDPDASKTTSENDTKDPGKDKSSNKQEPSVEEKISLLEKENKGLKNAVVEYRQDRAKFKTRLDEITQLIQESKNQRGSQPDDNKTDDSSGNDASKNKDKVSIDKLTIEYDEETGKAYLPADMVKQLVAEDVQNASKKTEEIEKALKEKDEVTQIQQAFQNHVSELLEKQPGRDEAYEKLTKALKMLDDKVIEIQQENGWEQKAIPKGAAIDLLSKTEGALDEFEKLGLPVSHDQVIRMFDSDYVFEKTLDSLLEAQDSKSNSQTDDDKLLENLKSKPASPGKSKSAKSSETVLDKLTGYGTEDLLEMDDKSWDRLMQLVEKETEE